MPSWTRADGDREQQRPRRRPEHVCVHQLPARLLEQLLQPRSSRGPGPPSRASGQTSSLLLPLVRDVGERVVPAQSGSLVCRLGTARGGERVAPVEVSPQRACHDHRDDAREQQHDRERVDERDPVHLGRVVDVSWACPAERAGPDLAPGRRPCRGTGPTATPTGRATPPR